MGLTKYRLGDLIELQDNRNSEGIYSVSDVRGISNTKELMPTKADMLNRSLDDFKIVYPNDFVYNRRTTRMGDKFAITINDSKKAIIVTDDYIVFRIVKRDIIIDEYLFMLFNRPEFDRYVRFNSWGSATEMFVWENMQDVVFSIPDIDQQRNFVSIYNALKENLAVYQSKADELKVVCDGYIDEIKNNSPKVKLSKILTPVDERNSKRLYSNVQGININKAFFPTVADVDSASVHNYKIVSENDFAFSGMQTGRDMCIRIALNEDHSPVVISPAYTVLRRINDSVLNHFILLWFSRKEVDRFGWFASDGSIRSNLDLERFFDMEIPLPSVADQRQIVNIHKCYLERQRIADSLKEQIKAICPVLIKGSLETAN